ncbi:MAG: spermidine/putrescine ABC transporter substrate-binding protein [Acidilobaceae archaeon]
MLRNLVPVLLLAILVLNVTVTAPAQERVLRVYNYSQYIDPEVLEIFQRETGIRVVYDEFESAEEAWAKLIAGGGGYDLIVLAHTHLKLAIDRGLLQRIDKNQIPNLAYLDPRLRGYPADPNMDYSIPYSWGATVIAYNKDCVRDPPRSWREFLSPDYLKRYSGRVVLLSEGTDVVEATMIALGYDINDEASWSKEVIDKVIDHLKKIRGYLRGFWGVTDITQKLIAGEICLAQAWTGDVLFMMSESDRVDFIVPEDGLYIWIDFMVIPRDARNVGEAHLFINFLLRPDIAARNAKYTYYPPPIDREVLRSYAVKVGDSELLSLIDSGLLYLEGYEFIMSPYLDESKLEAVTRVMMEVQAGRPLGLYLAIAVLALVAIASIIVLLRRRKQSELELIGEKMRWAVLA